MREAKLELFKSEESIQRNKQFKWLETFTIDKRSEGWQVGGLPSLDILRTNKILSHIKERFAKASTDITHIPCDRPGSNVGKSDS